VLHPEKEAGSGLGDDQPMTFCLGDFLVHEQILQLCGAGLADGVETVTWLPVAQSDRLANRLGIKDFSVLRLAKLVPLGQAAGQALPANRQATELGFTGLTLKEDFELGQ
ncbi:uncharacterized protein METZ01_LOCUS226168, partial [marine metagenome]